MDRPFLSAAAVVTAAAGALHLVAARAHTAVPLLAVGFVLVGLVQLALVALVPRRPGAAAELLVAIDLAAVGAWAVSRTVGLPGLPVETAGAGDVVAVALQLVAVALALAPAGSLRWATAVPGAAGALVVVALAAPSVGHPHGDRHVHAPADGGDRRPAPQSGRAPTTGTPWFDQPEAADGMRARMTGALGAVPAGATEAAEDGHGHGDDAPPHGH